MKVNIKDFDKEHQKAVRNILRSAGWDGREVNIYKEFETVIFEHKHSGQQVKIDDISEAIYLN